MDFFFAKWIGCGFGLAIFSSLNSEFVVVPLSLSLSLSLLILKLYTYWQLVIFITFYFILSLLYFILFKFCVLKSLYTINVVRT